MAEEARARGLPAIDRARQDRGKLKWPSPKFWAWSGLILVASGILYWKWAQGKIESERSKLMARQRAIAVELGPRWFPLRDSIERWTVELAKTAEPEIIEHEAIRAWDFQSKPGLYMRLRTDQATSPEAIRKGAKDSLRDAFTACLLRVPNPNPIAGKECKRTSECERGEICNELDHCSRPAQPFNARVAYRTMRTLSDEWVREVQEAGTELRLRALIANFDDSVQDDVPVAIDLLTRAQYFLLVLDEPAADTPPGQTPKTEELHAKTHMARIGVWRLSDGKPMLRIRREASGQLMGGTPSVEPGTLEARQRQANSCALAMAVREAMGDSGVGSGVAPAPAPESSAPVPSSSASVPPAPSASAPPKP